jgi:hypothetical protein
MKDVGQCHDQDLPFAVKAKNIVLPLLWLSGNDTLRKPALRDALNIIMNVGMPANSDSFR